MGQVRAVPSHIAFIMDGNGRWAQRVGKPRTYGHLAGAQKIEEVVGWCAKRGVVFTTFYAFSTENWKRPPEEVNFILNLLVDRIDSFYEKMRVEGVRLRFIGRIDELPTLVRQKCEEYEEKTKRNARIHVILALNYGGRAELVDALNRALASGIKEFNEDVLRSFLYAPDVPDPDLVIRTSGEQRLSNFLLWQTAYSELFFSPLLWPEFSEEELERAISSYMSRERRFGGITQK